MNYNDILNNNLVIENYSKIDEINPYPFNHGLKHVKNVCKIMNELCDTLKIDDEKRESLLIASALHDIGQVDGREEHGKKAKEFLIKNFEIDLNNSPYYSDILLAIENHDEPCDINNSPFTLLVQFCDKMDFSKERLVDNYRDRFRYHCYENIDRVEFIYDEEYFGINIITSNIDNFSELFLKENFPKKVINAVEVLAEKLNRKKIILNNGNKMNV